MDVPPGRTFIEARSAGTVTLGFGNGPTTSLTGWPINSHAAVSSVTTNPFARTAVSAWRMTGTRNVCGVCTDQRRERSTVFCTNVPPSDSLIVSVTGCAATAAPTSRAASMVAAINCSEVHGRAPSWMATISECGLNACKPFHTESWRSLPPATNRCAFRKPYLSANSASTGCIISRTTRTISSIQAALSNRCHVWAITGRPASSRKSLSTFGPMRVPAPAATMMAEVMPGIVGCRLRVARCGADDGYDLLGLQSATGNTHPSP